MQDFFGLGFTLPDSQHPPAGFLQHGLDLVITGDMFFKFLIPEFRSCGWCRSQVTSWVTVPETAMDEDDAPEFWKYDVRFAWKARHVKAIAQPC